MDRSQLNETRTKQMRKLTEKCIIILRGYKFSYGFTLFFLVKCLISVQPFFFCFVLINIKLTHTRTHTQNKEQEQQ